MSNYKEEDHDAWSQQDIEGFSSHPSNDFSKVDACTDKLCWQSTSVQVEWS